MKIIGITGTLGAGKGTVVEYLEQKGFAHYSGRAFFSQELNKRGTPINRDTMTELANELRTEFGPGYIAGELYKIAERNQRDAVIESIRTPGEVARLKEEGDFYLLAVDAKPEIRYERIVKRASDLDHVTYEKFLADEAREMHNSDPAKQNIAAVMEQADYVITNNGSLEELHAQIETVLEKIGASKPTA